MRARVETFTSVIVPAYVINKKGAFSKELYLFFCLINDILYLQKYIAYTLKPGKYVVKKSNELCHFKIFG